MPKISNELIMLLLAVVFIGLVMVFYKLKSHFKKGELIQTLLVDNRLVMVTSLHQGSAGRLSSTARGTNYIRLKIVDAESGRMIGKKIISPQYEIRMAVNGIIWLSLNRARYQNRADQELIGLDVFSMQKVFDQDKLKKILGISVNESFNSMSFDLNKGIILITDAAGFNHSFDCNTMQASGASKNISLPVLESLSTVLRLNSFHFEKMENTQRYNLYCDKKPIATNQSFVNPICLFTSEQDQALVFFHQRDLDGQSESYLSIARINESSVSEIRVLTAASKSKLSIALAGETKNHFFISTRHANNDFVIAIDKSTLAASWICKS